MDEVQIPRKAQVSKTEAQEKENLICPIAIKEIEFVIKTFPQQISRPRWPP